MARLARIVAEGVSHLVTQKGNRDQPVFFGEQDYRTYKDLLAEGCRSAAVEVLAYCLLPDRVHLILKPSTRGGLRWALSDTHRRYTRAVNSREGWRGYLWHGRFASSAMDEAHTMAAARYVELSPVRAGMAKQARSYRWSSAKAHLAGEDDGVVSVAPLLAVAPDWTAFLKQGLSEAELKVIQSAERTGRPMGSKEFVADLERRLGRTLARQKPGPKPKTR